MSRLISCSDRKTQFDCHCRFIIDFIVFVIWHLLERFDHLIICLIDSIICLFYFIDVSIEIGRSLIVNWFHPLRDSSIRYRPAVQRAARLTVYSIYQTFPRFARSLNPWQRTFCMCFLLLPLARSRSLARSVAKHILHVPSVASTHSLARSST